MSNSDYDAIGSSRIYNDSFVAQGAIDADVANWTKGSPFILGMAVWSGIGAPGCNKTYNSAQFKLQYEKSNNLGTYIDVDAANEISPGTTTQFNDDQADAVGMRLNDPSGAACASGYLGSNYNKEDKNLPDAGTIACGSEQWREFFWALDTDNAVPGIQYTFYFYNITYSIRSSAAAAQLTIASVAALSINVSDKFRNKETLD